MLISFKIALRYLFSKKSINIINIIALISTIGIMIATAALIIILSIFNGIEEMIISRFNAFNPELKVSLNEGKFFSINDTLENQLNSISNIKGYSFIMEDYAALKVGKITHPFPIRGVDNNYENISGVDTMLLDGEFKLFNEKNESMAIVGYEVSQQLSIGINFVSPIVIYAPKRFSKITNNPANAFNKRYLYPSAIYGVDESADNKVIIPLALAQELFDAENQATNIEICLKNGSLVKDTQEKLKSVLGGDFNVKNRVEQNSFYKILNSERLMIYLILGFVLLIAAFNIVATLTMLIVDKKKDFISFQSIGLSNQQIKLIFLFNGWMSSVLGALLGLLLGGFFIFLQIQYSLISFGQGFDIQSYPIAIVPLDFVRVFTLVLIIGFVTSLLPVRQFTKNYL